MARVLSIVLAGGEGKRLMPLTEDRAKRMSQPQQQKGTPASLKKNAAPEAAPAQQPAAPGAPGQIRQVGPQFLPNNTKQ